MVDFRNTDDGAFEERLRSELRVRPAPAGLAARIDDRIEAQAESSNTPASPRPFGLRLLPRFHTPLHTPLLRWAVAAMLLVSVAAGGYVEHQREQRIAGEHARQQVLLALRITSSTLQAVHHKVVDDDRTPQEEETQ